MRYGRVLAGLASLLLLCGAFAAPPSSAEVSSTDEAPCDTSNILASVRPDGEGSPTEVVVGVRLTDLTEINDVKQTLTGALLIRQVWTDPRLSDLAGCEVPRGAVWSPPIGFLNSGRMFTNLPEKVEIGEGGQVTYMQYYFGSLASYTHLRDFPFDEHEFKIWILSPDHSKEEIRLVVDDQFTGRRDLLNINDWEVEEVDAEIINYYVDAVDTTQSLFQLEIEARRIHSYYLWKIFLPLCLIVMMSWAVFWIDPSNFGPQIGLSATSMLTLIAFLFATTNMVPRLGYFTTLDLFLGGSLILVFLAFLESLMTTCLVSRDREALALRVDRICRVAFPALFLTMTALILSQ